MFFFYSTVKNAVISENWFNRISRCDTVPESIKISIRGKIYNPEQGEKMEKMQAYKCNLCGNIVEAVHVGGGQLVCCGQPMSLLEENTTDAAQEKHVPVIEKAEGGYKVKVGSVAHPMEEKHFIEWIELIAGEKIYRQFLAPGEQPEAFFKIDADSVTAREYCNLHGLWKG
jgi:superoxide reductase